MKRIMLVVSLLIMGTSALAETHGKSSYAYGEFGFATGGFTFGGGYDYLYNGSQGIGGQLNYYPKSTTRGANGYLIVGGNTSFHFFKGSWDFALSPGINIVNVTSVNPRVGNETDLGPDLSISLTTALNDKVSLGFDYVNNWIWFSNNFSGPILSNLLFIAKINL